MRAHYLAEKQGLLLAEIEDHQQAVKKGQRLAEMRAHLLAVKEVHEPA
jgi:hypothetical protein